MLFICEKKNAAMRRDRLVETLKKEKLQLQERLNAISTGPHAQRELKVMTCISTSVLHVKYETNSFTFVFLVLTHLDGM